MNEVRFMKRGLLVVLAVGLSASLSAACSSVIVGKDASVDGSVILGFSDQNSGKQFLNFRKIPRIRHKAGEVVRLQNGTQLPQVRETYSFLWAEIPGMKYSDSYLNEYGVAVVDNSCTARKYSRRKLEAEGQLVKDGIAYMLPRIMAERARTARQAVEVAAGIIEKVGYRGAETLVIADPKEAWLLMMVPGKQWVAQRVGDDQVVFMPNSYIINEVNLKDKANFLASPGLIEYAVKKGWYDPADGKPFNFSEAYSRRRKSLMDKRLWQGQCLITGRNIPLKPDRRLPFSVKPAGRMSVKDVITILRSHKQRICRPTTQETAVFQLRSKLPVDIGCVYWKTSAEPCTSVLTPWHIGITETPKSYYKPVELRRHLTLEYHFTKFPGKYDPDENHAWWVFKRLQDTVRRDYDNRVKVVRKVWDEYEAKLFAQQSAVEKKAFLLYRKDKSEARAFLTEYSHTVALEAVRKARELMKQFERK